MPPRLRGRLLDLDFLSALWPRAAPAEIADSATPIRFERAVLTVAADDPATRTEAHRRRAEIARRLLDAAGLPNTRLRIRVEAGTPAAPVAREEG